MDDAWNGRGNLVRRVKKDGKDDRSQLEELAGDRNTQLRCVVEIPLGKRAARRNKCKPPREKESTVA